MTTTIILSVALAAMVGIGIGFLVRHIVAQNELKAREKKGDEIIDKAKESANDIKYKARKEAKEIVNEERKHFDNEMKRRENDFKGQERGLQKKELALEQKMEDHDNELKKLKENIKED